MAPTREQIVRRILRERQIRREYERASRATKYEMTAAELEALEREQDGRCAICRLTQAERSGRGDGPAAALCIDHDHAAERAGVMKVRGLLCGECNTALRHFRDRIDLLERAVRYLLKPRGRRFPLFPPTVEQKRALIARQKGVCAICSMRKPLRPDHDHCTCLTRGLLCDDCNLGLGLFRDCVDWLRSAVAYLTAAAKRPGRPVGFLLGVADASVPGPSSKPSGGTLKSSPGPCTGCPDPLSSSCHTSSARTPATSTIPPEGNLEDCPARRGALRSRGVE
jgi:hypothetical protein